MLKDTLEQGSPVDTQVRRELRIPDVESTSQGGFLKGSNPQDVGQNKPCPLKVLLVAEQCNPDWSSVPLIAYRLFCELKQLVDLTLVTHDRNRTALERLEPSGNIIYIPESDFVKLYYKQVEKITSIGTVNWPLLHVLGYPTFAQFNQRAYQQVQSRILKGEFDVVHVFTPMEPRYPSKFVQACAEVPLLLGPVNGGVPFPRGFSAKAIAEFAYLNFLRVVGRRLIPGYRKTYQQADRILAGSTYTLNLVKSIFSLPDDRVKLFFENGIPDHFLDEGDRSFQRRSDNLVNLLFVGRLVPYKSADILLNAIAQLDPSIKARVRLTIVGEGSERAALEAQVDQLGLRSQVTFTGWVKQSEIVDYYRNADLFCFPSIREYGGGVVLEAMACGLPCIVANNGGIGEYVTDATGFRIDPISPEYLTQQLADKIQLLVQDESLRQSMAVHAVERVKEFTWQHKAQMIVDHYRELVAIYR